MRADDQVIEVGCIRISRTETEILFLKFCQDLPASKDIRCPALRRDKKVAIADVGADGAHPFLGGNPFVMGSNAVECA